MFYGICSLSTNTGARHHAIACHHCDLVSIMKRFLESEKNERESRTVSAEYMVDKVFENMRTGDALCFSRWVQHAGGSKSAIRDTPTV